MDSAQRVPKLFTDDSRRNSQTMGTPPRVQGATCRHNIRIKSPGAIGSGHNNDVSNTVTRVWEMVGQSRQGEKSILAMRTSAHKLLGFCGDGDGQSGLGAYVRTTFTFSWTVQQYISQISFPITC
jgi:hypothetical protein